MNSYYKVLIKELYWYNSELDILLACKKSELIYNNTTWGKTTIGNFDVTIGSFDSAQIADLVGIYILDTLGRFLNLNNITMNSDDRLIPIPNSNGPLTSKIQKVRAFKLKTEISSNLKIVDFFFLCNSN